MAKKKWEKSPQKLIDTFYDLMNTFPQADLRKMFGYPCAFYKGNMFVGLHEHRMVIRLNSQERDAALKQKIGDVFAPMEGRVMKEYITVSQEVISNRDLIQKLISQSFAYAKTLPPKG